jgi:hypothetical protein
MQLYQHNEQPDTSYFITENIKQDSGCGEFAQTKWLH